MEFMMEWETLYFVSILFTPTGGMTAISLYCTNDVVDGKTDEWGLSFLNTIKLLSILMARLVLD